MAGVYIKDYNVPDICDRCLSGFVKTIGCKKRNNFDKRDKTRHPDCPLFPVQGHGKLIDRDSFLQELAYLPPEMASDTEYILRKLMDMPVVIPADWEINNG